MYPFASLPDNLAAFCTTLRSSYGFGIGPRELHDAARALDVVELSDERVVRDALRAILSGRLDEARVFDEAFTEFFHPGPAGVPQPGQAPLDRQATLHAGDAIPTRDRERPTDRESLDEMEPGEVTAAPAAADEDDAPGFSRSSYSPLGSDQSGGPEVARADEAWRAAAVAFVRRVQLGLSRRWRPSARGRRFDLRRTLRASLQTGGEMLAPRWLRRPRRSPRFVLLIDGSRSMLGSAEAALQAAVAIASVTRRVDVFTFSTSLERVTADVRRAAAGQIRHLSVLGRAWGGGTTIGACLQAFLRTAGERTLGRDTVVMITSDGLDVGQPETLAAAMGEIRRRSAAVVWLNPLISTPGYEPTAAGMRAARPSVTTFACVNDAAGLARLGRTVRIS